MSLPDWLARELETIGAQNAERSITRAEAVTCSATRSSAAPTRVPAPRSPRVRRRSSTPGNRARRAAASRRRPSELFPTCPPAVVRPGVLRPVALRTATTGQWLQHAPPPGRRRDRRGGSDLAAFDGAYGQGPALLTGDLTQRDVLGDLEDGAAAAP